MLLKLLFAALGRQPRRKAMAFFALALGASAATTAAVLWLGIGDRLMEELKAYGANLMIEPVEGQSVLRESDLPKLETCFWRNNIQAASPLLIGHVQRRDGSTEVIGAWFQQKAGAIPLSFAALHPWMRVVEGRWPSDMALEGVYEAVTDRRITVPSNATLHLPGNNRALSLRIVGVLAGEETASNGPRLWMPLPAAQQLLGRPGAIDRVLIRALTTPEYGLLEKLHRDPKTLPAADYENWSCTSYPSTIALSIEKIWPGAHVQVQRKITEAEGRFLDQARLLVGLLALLGLSGAALAVWSTMSFAVNEERPWIALLRTLGATSWHIAAIYLGQALVLAVAGAALGIALGSLEAGSIARVSVGAPLPFPPAAPALALAVCLAIAIAGTVGPIRAALRLDPAPVLHEQVA